MTNKLPHFIIILCLCFAVGGVLISYSRADVANEPLVQSSDLVRQCAFRVPSGTSGGTFDYGGSGLAFNSANNSLFIIGNSNERKVAEISIPTCGTGAVSTLATAKMLQPFADVTEGRIQSINSSTSNFASLGGLLPLNGKLYVSAYTYYDGNGTQSASHFVSGLGLSVTGDLTGPFTVGTLKAGYVSGYMGLVPPAWKTALGGPALTGNCCIPIISRTSYGPAVFAFDPIDIGSKMPVPATPLVYYPATNPLAAWDSKTTIFNGSTSITGIVFPEGTRSVLFFGRHGQDFCYGPGTADINLKGTPDGQGNKWCYDPGNSSKGAHAYPYKSQVWAYDANELVAVKVGTKQPWDVKPYAIWDPLSLPATQILGVAYDRATGRIFVSQGFGDGLRPLIHVFTVGSSGSLTPIPVLSPTPTPSPTPIPIVILRPSPGTSTTPTPSITPIPMRLFPPTPDSTSIPSAISKPSPTSFPTPSITSTPIPPYSFFIPTPLPLSSKTKLIRAINTPQVYYITEKNLKRHIPNEDIFLSYGNNWVDVAVVSQSQVDAITDVTLIRSLPDRRVFKLENGLKRWVTSPETFNRHNFRWDQIAPINAMELNYYPIGSDIN